MTKEKALPLEDQVEILFDAITGAIDKTAKIMPISYSAIMTVMSNYIVQLSMRSEVSRKAFLQGISICWDGIEEAIMTENYERKTITFGKKKSVKK